MCARAPTGRIAADTLPIQVEGFVKAIHVVLAVSLAAVEATAGIYSVAATTASSMVASFNAPEKPGRMRIGEFGDAARKAVADYKAAREACERFAGAKLKACNAEARAEARRDFKSTSQM